VSYICSVPKCPQQLDHAGKCFAHRQAANKGRGTRAERGYDQAHIKLRAQLAPQVATGTVKCWRCGLYIPRGAPWDLGHKDDRSEYGGPEHVFCNRSAAGKTAH
jgi:hypothetical protein